MTDSRRKNLVLLRGSPYGSSLARAAVDLSLAMGAFEQDVQLLFLGDGVLQLLKGQQADAIGLKAVGKMLASLPLYDIESVYVDSEALRRHGLGEADLVLPVRPLDAQGIQSLMSGCDHILSC